jgi:two-component system chemotaxis response regulator CheB
VDGFAIIVIGASMGGVEALQSVAAGLPRDIPAALFVAQHVGRCASQMPRLLSRAGPLPAAHAAQGAVIRPGRIYVAPPDHHLLVERGHARLTRGPRENWARPAIDPLFRSAARAYGSCVIGVILTGMLKDGSAGLRAVRAAGGHAVVQDPADAAAPDMPWNALRHAGADYRLRLAEMPKVLAQLADELVLETEATPSGRRWRATT